jgi:hypothetical protein
MIAGTLPCCGYEVDAATGLDHEEAPTPGDYTICLNCGAVLRFVEGGPPQVVGLDVLELPAEAIVQMQRAIGYIRARGRLR